MKRAGNRKRTEETLFHIEKKKNKIHAEKKGPSRKYKSCQEKIKPG